ncbi:MAG: hypothetical protein M0022_05815, partial [Desulfobacteraceae bacterium]|nr:hypothetical protein [Desulfobacteraceae bacterium]
MRSSTCCGILIPLSPDHPAAVIVQFLCSINSEKSGKPRRQNPLPAQSSHGRGGRFETYIAH